MIKLLFLFSISVLFISCRSVNEKEVVQDESKTAIFKDSTLNAIFQNYMLLYDPSNRWIYTLTFDTDSTVIFSSALYVTHENLSGHRYLNKDILLIYGSRNLSERYLNMQNIKYDSISDFPYYNQVENLPPFDPIEKRYSLISKKELMDFKGRNIPVRLEE